MKHALAFVSLAFVLVCAIALGGPQYVLTVSSVDGGSAVSASTTGTPGGDGGFYTGLLTPKVDYEIQCDVATRWKTNQVSTLDAGSASTNEMLCLANQVCFTPTPAKHNAVAILPVAGPGNCRVYQVKTKAQ